MLKKYDISVEELAGMIDQTLLKPHVKDQDFKILCEKSMEYGFKTVAVNCAAINVCHTFLQGSKVLVDAAVGFPLGQSTIEAKVFETRDAIEKGAAEIDYVVNIVELKNGNLHYVENEMKQIVDMCRRYNTVSKVIFENCYLSDDEKRTLCGIALKVRPDFIKTSTGFGEWGAKAEDVRLMKQMVGAAIKVKASGGIRDLDAALEMIDAGAERIGTSAGVKIVDEYKELLAGR